MVLWWCDVMVLGCCGIGILWWCDVVVVLQVVVVVLLAW